MVNTIKFSEMTAGGDIANGDQFPGLLGGGNVLFDIPWTFLPPGTTAQRPAPSSTINYRLRFNTDDQLYEYYDAVLGMWTQIQESAFTVGPFITYTADASLPDAQNLGALANGILKQTITTGVATLDIAVNGTDFYGPGYTGYLQSPEGFADSVGAVLFNAKYISSAVNFLQFVNNTATNPPAILSDGSDAAVSLLFQTKTTGQFVFNTTISTAAFVYNTGTNYQHTTNFNFANTLATQNITWPDASGTVALTSGASGIINPGLINQLAYYAAAGTTLSGLTSANSATLTTDGSGNLAFLTLGAGQILVGTTSGAPAVTAISSGTNILVANGSGTISIGLTGIIAPTLGGTGVNNGSNTLTLAGTLATSGAFASTFTMTGATNVTFPTSGTLATVGGSVVSLQGTANEVLVNGTSGSPVSGTAITLTTPQAIGTSSTPTFANLILTGASIQFTGGLTMLAFTNVGSPVNYMNIGNAATGFGPTIFATGSDTNIPMNLATTGTGPFNFTSLATSAQVNFITGTATNSMTFPNSGAQTYTWQSSSGTVAFTSQIPAGSPSALTATPDTNVTITLGGTPATALLQATSITLGWTGTLSAARGGTGVGSLGTGVATAFGQNVVGSGGMALATTGTWTPVLTSSGGGTFTTSFLVATYTKIGNRLIWDFIMNISGVGSAGNLTITGLPQAAVNFSPCSIFMSGAQVTAAVVPMAYVQGSTINLYKYTTGTANLLTTGDVQAGTQLIMSGVC